MKLRVLNMILALSLSQFSFATSNTQPENCPSVEALQTVGVTQVLQEEGLWYGAVQANSYDTNDQWTFVIGAFRAKNENDAQKKAGRALNALTFQTGPEPFDIDGQESWVCLYSDNAGHQAATVTPTIPFIHTWLIRK
jgi:hypothetical protein